MSFIIGALKVIILLGFLILIHEGGHFLVAKACKVKVLEFAIGFGPKIFSKKGKAETTYSIRAIPLGGFCDMYGEEERVDDEGSFSSASCFKRFLIVVAGATVNIIFGILVYFTLITFFTNVPNTTIKGFVPEYSENLSELKVEDKILKINDKKIRLKSDIDSALNNSNGKDLKILVNRNGKELEVIAKPTEVVTKTIGVYFSVSSDIPKVKYIDENSVAEKVGIELNDVITKINNIEISTYSEISKIINESDELINVEVDRNGESKVFEIEPENEISYVLGIYLEANCEKLTDKLYFGFWDTTYYLNNILQNIKLLFTGNVNMNQMVGPIGISEMVVETNGVYDFFYLMCIVSLSLGVTNLLPIPALDGGKLLLIIIEAIRRKPLKQEVEITIQMIGFSILLVFSLYVSYQDILRIF